jgi:Xaa-Pro aminopeptidase
MATEGQVRRPVSMAERLNTPISTAELERRWAAVREAMTAEGIDVLLMQNNSESVGGYVRWFADIPAGYYPTSIVFPRDEPMSIIGHGPVMQDQEVDPNGGRFRGAKHFYSTGSFASAPYTRHYDSEQALKALAPYKNARIGLVSTYQMSFSFGEAVTNALPGATFTEFSDTVDHIKSIKSPEEIKLIRAAAALQDVAMRDTLDAVEPGMKESDVAAVARKRVQELGSEAGIFLTGSAPVGEPAGTRTRHGQNRVIQENDIFAILIEVDGPGGMYTELGRVASLGPIPQSLAEEWEFTLKAQRHTLDQLVPGANPADLWDSYNEFMTSNGRPPETRIYCHGQGYDLVERPFVRFDETMKIAENMNFACHPKYEMPNGDFSYKCDNWLVGPGGVEQLHQFPAEVIQL